MEAFALWGSNLEPGQGDPSLGRGRRGCGTLLGQFAPEFPQHDFFSLTDLNKNILLRWISISAWEIHGSSSLVLSPNDKKQKGSS